MKKLPVLILVLSFTIGLHAQNNNFLIYSFKGNISVVEDNTEDKAKVGKLLDSKASVKVAAGSALTLICNEAAMFTINKPGTYALSKLKDSCKINNSSVSANYVKYVWAQMTQSKGSPGSNRKAYMNTVGAVSRGGINNVWIDPRLDTVYYYSGSKFPLSWKSYAEAKEFDFFLYDAANTDKPLFTTTVDKLKIPIKEFEKKIKPGSSYYWTSAVKGETNEDFKLFTYVTKDTFDAILDMISKQGEAFEAPAEQAYRIAFMLEDAHYLAEALEYYTKAASLDSTNVLYRSTLMSFRKDYEIK